MKQVKSKQTQQISLSKSPKPSHSNKNTLTAPPPTLSQQIDQEILRFPNKLLPQLKMMVKPHMQIQTSVRCLLQLFQSKIPKNLITEEIEKMSWINLQKILLQTNLQTLLTSYKGVKITPRELTKTQDIFLCYERLPKDLLSSEFTSLCESLIKITKLLVQYLSGVETQASEQEEEETEQPYHLKIQMEPFEIGQKEQRKVQTPIKDQKTNLTSEQNKRIIHSQTKSQHTQPVSNVQGKKSNFRTPEKSRPKNQSQKSLLNSSMLKSPQSGKLNYKSTERRSLDRNATKPKQSLNQSFAESKGSKANKILHMKSKQTLNNSQYKNHSITHDPLERSLESEIEYERRLLQEINLKLEKYQQS